METGPPLNLSTSVKVEDCSESNDDEDHKLEIRNELVKHVGSDNQTYVLLQPVTDGSETLMITGEAVQESFVESSKASESDDIENSNFCISGNKNKTYRCSHCAEAFHRASQLRTHEKTHVEDKVHGCDQCPEIFSRLSLLVQHRQEHAKKVYTCSECDQSLSSYTSFRVHMKNHKSERKFNCVHCSMSFSQQSHLITHLRKHTGEKPFICPMCSTRFKQVSHLTTHLRTHTNDRPYACDICNAAFSQTGSLKRHKRSHTGEKPFKCLECNAVFVEKRNLNRHLLSHSGVRPFKCDLCPVSFTQLIDLKRHTLSHSGIKPYKCDICDASFSRKNNLKWHKRTHEGDTPHICDICNVGFRIARDLKNHKRNHSENKPYSCNQCNSCFSQLTTLKRHSLVHSGQKHFSCQECNAAFFEKSALKRHVQRHGNNKPFSCDLCLTSFLEARTLKRHKVVMHSEGKYGDNASGEENEEIVGEIKVNTGIVKNLQPVADDENSLHIYEPVHQKPQKMEPVPDIPLVRNEILPHSSTPEIYINAINSQNTSQQPTLVLTEPGKPPKTGRPANNCQNHNSHVHTLLEGSYNPWQTWCFCDPPNIPSQADSLEIQCSSSQPVILNPATSPINSQSSSQPLEYHSNDMLAPVLVEHQQQIPVHSSKIANNAQGAPSSFAQVVTKGNFGSQVSNKITAQVPQFSNSQADYQSADGYQHYSGSANCNSDMSLINDCHQAVNSHEQHITGHSQRIISQGSKASYLHIPCDEIISSSFSSLSSQDNFKKQFSFEKDQSKITSQVSQTRDSIINTLPAISKVESLNNTSHTSVIIVANESSKHCSQAQMQHSNQNSFAEGPSQIVSMDANQSVPTYKEFSQNNSPHEMNYQHNIQMEPDHRKIEGTPEQTVDETQNVVYEQLPHACNNKNQVTLQYSLTVNNPATGEIQIQSDLFSAKSPVSSDPKLKKKKIAKQPIIQDKKLNCTYCPKTFVKQGPLEMHIRTHTGEKPFICGICNQHFSHNNSLTIHMRSHTGERPYTCIYCGATFTQKSNLRVHHRTHTGEKPFKCSICEVSFSQGSHLKAHIRIHNNDRPFVCSICGQAFTQRSALKRHQMKHTGMKPHSCNECDSKFSQKDDLRRHQSNHTFKSKSLLSNKKKKNSKNIKIDKDYSKATKNSSLSPAENCAELISSEINESEQNNADAGRSTNSSEIKLEPSPAFENNILISEEFVAQRENSNPIELKSSKDDVKRDAMEISLSLKMSKNKPRAQLVEPSRISRRIKEAAERKKLKIEDSDFITGDLEEIDLAEEMENTLIKATLLKVGKKKDGNKKMYSDGVVQSWCFCEVPHGPNEPHTHIEASKSGKKIENVSVFQESSTIEPMSTNVIKNEDYRGGALQFGLQQIPHAVMLQGEQITLQREQTATHISENHTINSGTTLSDVRIISSNNGVISSSMPKSLGAPSMPTSSNSTNTSQVQVNHLPVVEMEDGKAIYTSAQIISAQVLSGGQFITPDGTFFIEAGDIINNGTVVLNSSTPGTFYFDLGAEGQFVNVPVSTSTMGQDTQVLVPATTIVEGGNHVYSPSTQAVSIHSDANSFSDHIEGTLLDNSQRASSVFPNSVNNNMIGSMQGTSEQAESFPTSQIENLQYTSLDNNELTLFNPNVDFQTLTNVVVKQVKSKKVKKSKSSVPIVVNPCKCTVCGKVFAQKVTLRTHMEEVHKGLQYCGVCFDAFTSKEHLNTHKLQHQTQSLSCSECSLSFETKNALTQHKQKLHNIGRYSDVKKEQRAFMCTQCDSRFYQRSDLKRHNLGHTGEKPFKCWQCGAGFTRKYSLKKHERIHTGEKPYNCQDCDQSFAYRHQYNRHLATHPAVEEISTDPNILAIPLSHVLS